MLVTKVGPIIICFSLLHMSKKKREGIEVETTLLTLILVAWLHLIAPDVALNLVLAGIVEKKQYQWPIKKLTVEWEGWNWVART